MKGIDKSTYTESGITICDSITLTFLVHEPIIHKNPWLHTATEEDILLALAKDPTLELILPDHCKTEMINLAIKVS